MLDFFNRFSIFELSFLAALLLTFVILMGYYLCMFLPVVTYKLSKKDEIDDNSVRAISVVVAVQDDIDFLENEVEKIMNQNFSEPYQLVIVDNQSVLPRTIEILTELKERYENIYITKIPISTKPSFTPQSNRKLANAVGVKGAKYENIVLLSPRVKIKSEKWLHLMAKGFDHSSITTSFCRIKKRGGIANMAARSRNILHAFFYLSKAINGNPYMVTDGAFGFKRNLFFENSGFTKKSRLARGESDLFIQSVAKPKSISLVLHPNATVERDQKGGIVQFLSDQSFYSYHYRFYPLSTKIYSIVYHISTVIFWCSAIYLLGFGDMTLMIISGSVTFVKLMTLIILAFKLSKRTEQRVPLYLLFYDILAPFEQLIITLKNLVKPRKDIWV
ncbi:MAG: hypothetical protein R3Y50_00910 [Rikenellaceae bacterium]